MAVPAEVRAADTAMARPQCSGAAVSATYAIKHTVTPPLKTPATIRAKRICQIVEPNRNRIWPAA